MLENKLYAVIHESVSDCTDTRNDLDKERAALSLAVRVITRGDMQEMRNLASDLAGSIVQNRLYDLLVEDMVPASVTAALSDEIFSLLIMIKRNFGGWKSGEAGVSPLQVLLHTLLED